MWNGPGLYKHYKGGEYIALGLALHTETKEVMVYYLHRKSGTFYVRPMSVWNQPTPDGKERFVFVQPEEK